MTARAHCDDPRTPESRAASRAARPRAGAHLAIVALGFVAMAGADGSASAGLLRNSTYFAAFAAIALAALSFPRNRQGGR